MRGHASFAILRRLGPCALALPLGLLTVSLPQSSRADDTVILEIPDHPGAGAVDLQVEEEDAEPPAEELMIADAIKVQSNKPSLQKGQHADDVAALTEFYRTRTGPALWLTTAGFSERGAALLEVIGKADNWGLDPTAFPVPPKDYKPSSAEDQAATELAISLAALKYARAARGGLDDPKNINPIYGHEPTVRPPAEVLKELSTASAPDEVLLELHPKHEQFVRLRKALANAKSENEDLLLRRNMNRWRWMPEDLGATYVWLNIPEFMVYAVEDGKTVESEKALVGATSSPTPVLSADMTEIVFNPERIVPPAVFRRDVLPKLRGSGSFFGGTPNTAVLDQYGITVKKGGRTVDPKTIDWRKANLSGLTFVQKPGRTNIMGNVQFLFPNDRKVFMRATTFGGKFARDTRADGAKEPRVDNAEDLAARILAASNGTSSATVRQQIASGKTSRVSLTKPIPVHLTYFTAVVGDDGTVKTFGDIYELDNLPAATPAPAEDASSAPAAGAPSSEAPDTVRKPINGSLATTSP
ncbi:hypothetical protein GL4_1052 [Methyloceanibacter caenitepidi]|uniref:Uncharacterized protein n=1 Tax=Methyloceanibacter caenitepidi TaxID=1384459 RepID=A0A0A8K1W0_9HYPH|nr:hypothetical protein GL4_1052 [Methyloceanibacter caenitepidi]